MNRNILALRFTLLLLVALFLSGCVQKNELVYSPQDNLKAASFNTEEELLAIEDEGVLVMLGSESGYTEQVYTFQTNDLPPRRTIKTFLVSPTRQFVVWYSPAQGILSLSVPTGDLSLAFTPSEWFNTNPYLWMDNITDRVYFIDDEGRQFYTLHLESGAVTTFTIPFPYGTLFRMAPDGSKILYISGYGQDDVKPSYLITDVAGKEISRFTTDARVNARHLIDWLPDSERVVTLNSDATGLTTYQAISPGTSAQWFQETDAGSIIDFAVVDEMVFVLEDDQAWRVLDSSGNVQARIPLEIAVELNNPTFLPQSPDMILIEETLTDGMMRFNRLWQSNQYGSKQILFADYHHVTVIDNEPL